MKVDKKKNTFYVRIYDDDILTSVYELFETKQFASMNDLMNKALALGIEKIYLTYGKRRALSSAIEPETPASESLEKVSQQLRNMELTINDLFVMMNVLEIMLSLIHISEPTRL